VAYSMTGAAVVRRARILAMHRMPNGYASLSQVYHRNFRWKDEREYLDALDRGEDRASGPASVLFFGYHRSGSMFASGRVDACGRAIGLTPLNLRGHIVSAYPERLHELTEGEFWENYLRSTGYLYGPIRQPIAHAGIENYRSVALFRDPRDALVSHYYSIRYAHTLLNERNVASRQAAAASGIDKFVLSMVPKYASDLTGMADLLAKMPQKLVTNYDEMMGSYDGWIRSIIEFLEVDPSMVSDIVVNYPRKRSAAEAEDLRAHNRSGRSGQFHRELKPETVAIVERELGGISERLGVPLT